MCYDIELYALLLCVCVKNLRGEMDDQTLCLSLCFTDLWIDGVRYYYRHKQGCNSCGEYGAACPVSRGRGAEKWIITVNNFGFLRSANFKILPQVTGNAIIKFDFKKKPWFLSGVAICSPWHHRNLAMPLCTNIGMWVTRFWFGKVWCFMESVRHNTKTSSESGRCLCVPAYIAR